MGYRVNRIPTMTPRGIVGGKRIRGYSRGLGTTDAEYDDMFQWETDNKSTSPTTTANVPSSSTTSSSGGGFFDSLFSIFSTGAEDVVNKTTEKVNSTATSIQKELDRPINMPTMTTKPQVTTTAQPPPSAGMSTTAKVTLGVIAVGGLGLLVLALKD